MFLDLESNLGYNLCIVGINMKKLGSKVSKVLAKIAKKLSNGGKYLDYEKELDKVLGTELKERDVQAEGDWERYNKGTENGLDGKSR